MAKIKNNNKYEHNENKTIKIIENVNSLLYDYDKTITINNKLRKIKTKTTQKQNKFFFFCKL